MSTNAPAVENLLNFRLWRLLTQASAPVIRLCEGRFGIARREWALMATMAGSAEGLPPSVLAERVGVDRAQVSKTCAALAAKGLIERTAVRGDSRRANFCLTDAGRALHAEIHAEVRRLAAAGSAVVFASSELEEVLLLADRIIVMHDGAVAGEIAAHEATEVAIMRLATGGAVQGLRA